MLRREGWLCWGNGTVWINPSSVQTQERSWPSSGPEFLAVLSAGKSEPRPLTGGRALLTPSPYDSSFRCTALDRGAAEVPREKERTGPALEELQSNHEHYVHVCNGEEQPFFWMAGYSKQKVLLFLKLSLKHEELITHHLIRWQKIFKISLL